jgi:subtilisin family serine protease
MNFRSFLPVGFLLTPVLSTFLIAQLSAQILTSKSPLLARTSSVATPTASGRYLVLYRSGQISGDAAARSAQAGGRIIHRLDQLGIAVVEGLTPATAQLYAQDPSVEAIVPDILMNAHTLVGHPAQSAVQQTPDALYHSPQGWAVKQVGGYGADGTSTAPVGPWNTSKGKGIRIAILDSGVDPNHPDIAPNLVLNLSEIVPSALPSACDDGTPLDQTGHGTWTASLAAGALGQNTGLVAGVAPEAHILNIKVLQRMPAAATAADPSGCINGQASGLMSWVLEGIADAVTNGANIISMSLGTLVDITTGAGAGQQALFNRATLTAYNAGIVLVAAAGNDGFNTSDQQYIELPAQSRNVLAIVASTNPACAEDLAANAVCASGPITLPYYSNYGAPLNALAAPGGSYPSGGAVDPETTLSAVSGWVTGACSNGRSSTLSGPPSDSAHSMGCFNLGHAGYVQAMGTSASAPLVAGAAALLMAANPSWSPSTVVQQLQAAALTTPSLATPQVSIALLLTPKK